MNQVRMLLEGMYLLGLCANPRASNCGVTANTVVEPLESGALSLQVPEDLPNLPLLHSKSEELRIQSIQTEPTKKFSTIYRCGKCHDHIWLLAVGHM